MFIRIVSQGGDERVKKSLSIVLVALSVLLFVAAAFAASKGSVQKSVRLSGEVVKNDGEEMVVKGPSGEQTFKVTGVSNASRYKPGDRVTISISKPPTKGKEEKELWKFR